MAILQSWFKKLVTMLRERNSASAFDLREIALKK